MLCVSSSLSFIPATLVWPAQRSSCAAALPDAPSVTTRASAGSGELMQRRRRAGLIAQRSEQRLPPKIVAKFALRPSRPMWPLSTRAGSVQSRLAPASARPKNGACKTQQCGLFWPSQNLQKPASACQRRAAGSPPPRHLPCKNAKTGIIIRYPLRPGAQSVDPTGGFPAI